jgi:hypothetical protein
LNKMIKKELRKLILEVSEREQQLRHYSEEFLEWFKGSVIVNSKGWPVKVYHQTSRKNVSSITKDGFHLNNMQAGKYDPYTPYGFFFKPDDKDIGISEDPVQMEFYIKIINPLEVSDTTGLKWTLANLSQEYSDKLYELKMVDKKYGDIIDDLSANYKRGESEKYSRQTKEIFDVWKKKYNELAVGMKEDASNILKSKGYDGIILHQDKGSWGRHTTTYIVFSKEQIRSADSVKKGGPITEVSQYIKIHPDDEYEIEGVKEDNNHRYKYVDNVKYELSLNGTDEIVNIDQVESTPENTYYEEQIERYVEYIQNGGIIQTFPVQTSKICYTLECMLKYLDESDNFDIVYDLLHNKYKELYNIFLKEGLYMIHYEAEDYGFEPDADLSSIRTINELSNSYIDQDNNIYHGLVEIMEYFEYEKEYTLTDFNHRFEALKRLGKKRIMVEV